MTQADPSAPGTLEGLLRPQVFRALSEPSRLAVVLRLAHGPRTVSEVQDCCGIHLSGVSRHLKELKRAGVVESQRRGREVVYRLRSEDLAAWFTRLGRALSEASACCPPEEPEGERSS